jgi:uncharacterized protein (DUF58 family)
MLAREIIQSVRQIQIRTGRQVADVLAGEYVSVFKGSGVEFDEVRPYIPGDDVRTIDWNVTARMGSPFVKRYVEERQLTIMLMTDISTSQDFGSAHRSKREATAELCALLAFSAIRNDDKVGLTLFHGGIEQYVPPRKGQKHVLRVVREVLAHGEAPESLKSAPRPGISRKKLWPFGGARRRPRTGRQATNIEGAMEFLMKVAKRKTVCFVVSDFLDDGFDKAMQMANRKHDVIAVQITDPRESALPNTGLVTLADPETGQARLYDTGSKTFRKQFEQANQKRNAQLERRFRSSNIDFVRIDASGSIVDPLVRFFKLRERRMRR